MRSAEQRHCFLCSAVTRRLADAKPWMPLLSCLPGRLGGDIAWVYAFILHFIQPSFLSPDSWWYLMYLLCHSEQRSRC